MVLLKDYKSMKKGDKQSREINFPVLKSNVQLCDAKVKYMVGENYTQFSLVLQGEESNIWSPWCKLCVYLIIMRV